MANAAVSHSGRTPEPSVKRVGVPLLAQLLAPEELETRRVWMDAGRAQAGLINRLTGTPSRLIVADMPRARERRETGWHLPDAGLAGAFWSESVDRFLCWDLLNYMDKDQLAELSRSISKLGGGNCTIHALIQYSRTTMTEAPACFSLDDDLQLVVTEIGQPESRTPRYSPKALEKAMPELRVERTMLLNNGMQEFLFSLR